jgi:protease IV
MKRFFQFLMILILVMFMGGVYLVVTGSLFSMVGGEPEVRLTKDSVLLLRVSGVIINAEKVLKQLDKYGRDDKVKAVVIRIDSPGGVVGASQEYYTGIKKFKASTKKPVIMSCSNLAASGAYYTAVAGDVIYTNPGTLMGSIGVIMEFANLQGLYDWAKIKRYVVKTGPFKDSGAEYRPMRDDELKLFQSMIDEVYKQFKQAVADGRKLPLEKVEPYADGRIFTGEFAVKNGFADKLGDLEDAIAEAGILAKIKGKPEVFEPKKWKPDFLQFFIQEDEDESASRAPNWAAKTLSRVLRTELLGKPLYLLPGVLEGTHD